MRPRPASALVLFSAAAGVGAVGSHAVEGSVGAVVSAAVILYVVVFSALHAEEAPGAGDGISFVRVALLAYVAGFVVSPPDGTEAWVVAGVFILAAVLDAFDGAVARRTRETKLGESLDAEVDGLAVLVGVSVGISAGWLPLVYAPVALARYVFVGGIKLRRSLGLTVAELDDSLTRKLLSVAQTAVIFGAFVPPVPASVVRPTAVVAMVPFLAWFTRDWLVVCGRHKPE